MAGEAAEREYRLHERAVHAALARRHPSITVDERAELYQEAWASVLSQRARGKPIEALEAYLVGAADKLAAKRLHGADARRRIAFDPLEGPFARVADESCSPEERALAAEEERRLRMLVDELGARERAVLKLRLDAGLEADEIRERLGLSARQYRRIAERAGRALLAQLAADGGPWARRQRSLLCACAFGIASERQRERARRLVESDPFCRATMRELRSAGRRAGALLPLPSAGEGRPAGRLAELLGAGRDHALGLSSRALEATPLAGARPGAATAVVAGCLAAGGGAICAVEGVPDGLRPAAGEQRRAKRDRPPKERPRAPVPVAAPAAPAAPRAATPPPVKAAPPPPAPTPAPAREFEPVAPRAASAPAAARPSSGSPEFSP